jgi:hypothetical protein
MNLPGTDGGPMRAVPTDSRCVTAIDGWFHGWPKSDQDTRDGGGGDFSTESPQPQVQRTEAPPLRAGSRSTVGCAVWSRSRSTPCGPSSSLPEDHLRLRCDESPRERAGFQGRQDPRRDLRLRGANGDPREAPKLNHSAVTIRTGQTPRRTAASREPRSGRPANLRGLRRRS